MKPGINNQNSDKSFMRLYIVSFTVFGIIAAGTFILHSSLNSSLVQVKKQRSRVIDVISHQSEVIDRFRGKPDNAAKVAEIAGAKNRIRVEKRRYDSAASNYNEKAGTLYGRIIIMLFGLPENFPLSNKTRDWSEPQ